MNIPGLQQLTDLERQHNLPSGLLAAVMNAESGGNPNAVSPAGAQGLFQFMPATAKELGIDPLNPQQAAEGAARYYGQLSNKYGGDLNKMLGAYNWGMGNVDRKGLESAPKETRDYISKITSALSNDQLVGSGNDSLQDDLTDAEKQELSRLLDQEAKSENPELTPDEIKELRGYLGLRQPLQAPKAPKDITGGALQTALERGASGLLSNYADELTDPIVAAVGSMKTGIPYEQFLQATRERGVQREQAQREQYPVLSTLSEIGGGVGQLFTGAGAIKAASPALAAKGAQIVASSPYLSALGIGAAQGALSGSGAAEEGQRGEGALLGGAIGGALAPAGAYVARNVAEPVIKSGLRWIADKFGSKTITPKSTALTEVEKNFVPTAKVQEGEIFPKTTGQRSQIADIQRLETAAEAGHLTPRASEAFAQAKTIQDQEFKRFMGKLAGGEGDINSSIDNVASIIKTRADDAWQRVGDAYKIAREGGGVKINADDIKQGLWKSVAGVRREMQADLSQMPQARSTIKRLAKYSSGKMNRITSVKLNELENWRTAATTAANNADGAEQVLLRRMVRQYDDFMERTAASAADQGDSQAINAFKTAVQSRAEYGRLFEKNKLVNELVEGNLSVDDARRKLIGAGTIKSKGSMLNNYRALKAAAGDQGEAVADDLRKAFVHDVVKKSYGTFAPGTQEQMLSPAKLATNLKALFKEQSAFAKELFGDDMYNQALQAIKELEVISRRQPKVESSSGSGEYIARFLMQRLNKVPFLTDAVDSVNRASRSKTAMQSLSEFMDIPTFEPKSPMWSSVAGQLTGQEAGDTAGRTRIVITEGTLE